jgi:hypothetical protein
MSDIHCLEHFVVEPIEAAHRIDEFLVGKSRVRARGQLH